MIKGIFSIVFKGVLIMVYFAILFPAGRILTLIGKNKMKAKRKKGEDRSYFVHRDQLFKDKDLLKPY